MSASKDSFIHTSDLSSSNSDEQSGMRQKALLSKRSGPGILVMIEPMHLSYMNDRARELLATLQAPAFRRGLPSSARGILPPVVLDICEQLFQHLRERTEAKDWEQFEARHLICHDGHGILLRGFGLPDLRPKQSSRLLLLLERVLERKDSSDQTFLAEFGLTSREHAVIQCLAKGQTNKEIANALGIALTTVKDHIRHIMEKTNTSTRTGILMRIFQRPPA